MQDTIDPEFVSGSLPVLGHEAADQTGTGGQACAGLVAEGLTPSQEIFFVEGSLDNHHHECQRGGLGGSPGDQYAQGWWPSLEESFV